jgi:hypothetical protein
MTPHYDIHALQITLAYFENYVCLNHSVLQKTLKTFYNPYVKPVYNVFKIVARGITVDSLPTWYLNTGRGYF